MPWRYLSSNQVIDQLNRNEVGVPEHPIVTPVQGDWVDGATLPNRVLEAVSNEA
ncbi:MAG: hypothetical protein O3C20_13520 [Verrucomicrobia bacterium]|nr:hypothetical protein [Verrucomicrobiota bacterium]